VTLQTKHAQNCPAEFAWIPSCKSRRQATKKGLLLPPTISVPPPGGDHRSAAASTQAHCRCRLHASATALLYGSCASRLPLSQRDCRDLAARRRHLASPTPYAQATSYNSTTLLRVGGTADSWNNTTLQIFDHTRYACAVCSVHWPNADEYLHRALRLCFFVENICAKGSIRRCTDQPSHIQYVVITRLVIFTISKIQLCYPDFEHREIQTLHSSIVFEINVTTYSSIFLAKLARKIIV
jgi:hypothetical protein